MLKPSLDDLFKSSIRSILKNKSRTLLTSLGIIIGVTSVILLTSIGNGLKEYVSEQFDMLGANSIFISPGRIFNDKGGFSSGGGAMMTTSFTTKDVTNLRRNLKNTTVLPASVVFVDIKSIFTIKKSIEVVGTTYDYGVNNNLTPSSGNGRWFTKEEEDKNTNATVLGYQLAQDLFPNQNPLNKKIIIKGKNFKIIGTLDKKGGGFGGPNLDEHAFAPIGVVFNIAGNEKIQQIMVKTADKDSLEGTKKDITKVMKEKYDDDAFSVYDSSQLLNSINAIISTLTIALTGIAAISLIVGGIGIMNIMLVTVTERTREIGLRKAIGAYPRAILIQFLFEAIILAGIGGFLGIVFGYLGTLAINNFFPAKITFQSVLLAFGVSSLVGIIFGVAPARRASKLSPIQALRYE